MSSISGLTVLTLSLGRINLLKENMIEAELPFCKHKNLIYTWHQATKWVCCCQLSESLTILCNEDLCLFLAQSCTNLWGDHTLTCASVLPCNKVKKAGWFQVMRNKASSSLYWSPGQRCHVCVWGLEKPHVPFPCITDISSVSAGGTSKATG